ncbi:MAG: hypothetical protein UHI81_02405 [Olegusella sp.]|nr:hypothetical protein [Olegusella sp.]
MGEEGRPAAGFPFKGFNVEIPVKFDAGAMQQNLAKAGGVVKENAGKMGEAIGNAAGQAAESAQKTRDEITDKITELDRMLEQEITNYNDAYTLMNDRGIQLFVERSRSVDTIENVKALVNSIANRPKTFDDTFAEIETNRQKFTDACEFADRELDAARKAAGGAGAAVAAGASVAFMAPTAALWVATTFGTASTGVAISSLSGAAATNAALAWLGGGALAAGGGGISAGGAFLAMAGPIGWTVAGATLLTTIVVFAKKRVKLNAEKSEEIEKVKRNTEAVRETDAKIAGLLGSTRQARDGLNGMFRDDISLYGKDYSGLSDMEKKALGNLVNNTLALSAMMDKTIE